MNLLDRYIARQFLLNTLILLVVLFSFIVMIDLSLNLHRFIRVADAMTSGEHASALRKAVVTLLLVGDLWWPKLLQLFNFVAGLVMIAAMGFTCSQLVRHRELVAVLAGGRSLQSVARPIVIGALVVTALQAANQELVLPRIAPLLSRQHEDAGSRSLAATRVPALGDGQGRWWYAESFDADAGELENIRVWETDPDGQARRLIAAEHAVWSDGAWRFDPPARVEELGAESERIGQIESIETDLEPNVIRMRRYEGYAGSLGFGQLTEMIKAKRRLGRTSADRRRIDELQRLRFGRFALLAANLLTLIVCIPFFLTRVPTNMVAQSLRCAPVAVIGLLGGVLGSAAPIPGAPAVIGVFIPVLVLVPIAIATSTAIRT